ncbi:protein translocase subunit SecF [Minwuia thermotolerans]|uniref:Protein-export membrane protein SecF n=1 Tax=Minwuia thermotolerans TaxID=2056226 RepID=A0A2M9G1N7_9PROT|nr:protein translocase subunit SecF [Minwuia thermotolerans]PJK29619.1 protein translocase subunit SecF [Minwuia thermotolerans]
MFRLRMVPEKTAISFMKFRIAAFALSSILALASAGLFFGVGLNRGIDFEGGILIEVATQGPADLAEMRDTLGGLGLGEVALQEFGAANDVLIRVERQPGEAEAQEAAIDTVKAALEPTNPGISYRRVEFVGPKVSGELVEAAVLAVLTAVVAMLFYIWLRFEWQFSLGAVAALVHDVILTIGFFAITRTEFNLASVAAILTIVGYSINDTVVVYDRVRENLRKFKQMPLGDLLDRSINDTLSRTVVTGVTTLLALGALFFFGGEVIRGFSAALIWGIVIGTYSSIFIAAPMLPALGLQRNQREDDAEEEAAETT